MSIVIPTKGSPIPRKQNTLQKRTPGNTKNAATAYAQAAINEKKVKEEEAFLGMLLKTRQTFSPCESLPDKPWRKEESNNSQENSSAIKVTSEVL